MMTIDRCHVLEHVAHLDGVLGHLSLLQVCKGLVQAFVLFRGSDDLTFTVTFLHDLHRA